MILFNRQGSVVIFYISGILFVSSIINLLVNRLLRRYRERAAQIPMLRLLLSELVYLFEAYQRLDYKTDALVSHPFHSNSWPEFGEDWGEEYVRLFSLNEARLRILPVTAAVFKNMGWVEGRRLLAADDTVIMLDVIEGLRECIDKLRQYIGSFSLPIDITLTT